MKEPVVEFSADEAEYVGDDLDGVYVQAAEGDNGWVVTCVVDCDSAGFVENLVTDMGPYDLEEDAMRAGRDVAMDWCISNGVGCEGAIC